MAMQMFGSSMKRPGGRYAEWTDSIEDDLSDPESSKRVITAPLPRVDPPSAPLSATTTAPLGRRLEGHATSTPKDGRNASAQTPPSALTQAPIPIENDALIDSLLDKLPSPLRPVAGAQPEGFAVSAGPVHPPQSLGAAPLATSILVTDSVLKGRLRVDPNSAIVTAVSSRRGKASPNGEERGGREEPAPLLYDHAAEGRRSRARLVAWVSVVGAVLLLGFGLVVRAFFAPLPDPAQQSAVAPKPPPVLPLPADTREVPMPLPPPSVASSQPTEPSAALPPSTPVRRAPRSSVDMTPKPVGAKPASSASSSTNDDDFDMQIKIKDK